MLNEARRTQQRLAVPHWMAMLGQWSLGEGGAQRTENSLLMAREPLSLQQEVRLEGGLPDRSCVSGRDQEVGAG